MTMLYVKFDPDCDEMSKVASCVLFACLKGPENARKKAALKEHFAKPDMKHLTPPYTEL